MFQSGYGFKNKSKKISTKKRRLIIISLMRLLSRVVLNISGYGLLVSQKIEKSLG